jgi:hypothetical protein
MYHQPKIRKSLILKLRFKAKKEWKKATTLLNEILEKVLTTESEPPPYEKKKQRMYEHTGSNGTLRPVFISPRLIELENAIARSSDGLQEQYDEEEA